MCAAEAGYKRAVTELASSWAAGIFVSPHCCLSASINVGNRVDTVVFHLTPSSLLSLLPTPLPRFKHHKPSHAAWWLLSSLDQDLLSTAVCIPYPSHCLLNVKPLRLKEHPSFGFVCFKNYFCMALSPQPPIPRLPSYKSETNTKGMTD